jgi:hypothetical protein
MECQICVSQMKGVKRTPVKCMYCDFVACLECCKKYILEHSVPQCMNVKSVCSREWTRRFLVENFPHNFLNVQYKNHRENVLLEQERALFVETQPYVTNEIDKEKVFKEMSVVNERIAELNKVYSSLLSKYRGLYRKNIHERQVYTRCCPKNGCRGFLTQQWKCGICETKFCKHCHQELNHLQTTPEESNTSIHTDTESHTESHTDTDTEPHTDIYTEPHTNTDTESHTDTYTHTYTEPHTQEELKYSEEETKNEFIYTNSVGTHICKEDDVETAKLLEKNTKPCPSCNMGIFKIDGCNQMFCTNCNTAFDWVTRNIMNGNIHNPHYFEWIRRQEMSESANNDDYLPHTNNNPHDCRNGGITNETSLSLLRIRRFGRNLTEAQNDEILEFVRVCRNILHIREVVMPMYIFNYAERNREIRILFMRNKITENEFKKHIQKNDKKYSKSQEIYHVFQFLVNSTSDIVLRYLDSLNRNIVTNNALKEVETIVEYANGCFTEISNVYRSKRITLTNTLHI